MDIIFIQTSSLFLINPLIKNQIRKSLPFIQQTTQNYIIDSQQSPPSLPSKYKLQKQLQKRTHQMLSISHVLKTSSSLLPQLFRRINNATFHSMSYSQKPSYSSNYSRNSQKNLNSQNSQNSQNNQNNQSNKFRKYRQQQQKNPQKEFKHNKVEQCYYDKLFEVIQPGAKKVIQMLLNPSNSKKQVVRELSQYLQFKNLTFEKDVRSDVGCMAILVAMNNMDYFHGTLQEYQSRIVDFITMTDINNSQYDSTMLRYLFLALNKRMAMNIQKNIRQYYRLRYVQIAMDNFERLDHRDLGLVAMTVQEALQKDSNNFITKWRFFPLFQAIQESIIALILEHLSPQAQPQRKQQIQRIISSSLLYKYEALLSHYEYMTPEHALIFYEYLVRMNSHKGEDFNFFKIIINAFTKLPYVEINHKRQTIRQKFLAHFEERYNQSASFRSQFSGFNPIVKRYMIQKFFQDEFHKVFKQLPFEVVSDKYTVLKEKDLKKPQIPQFVWRLFKQDERKTLQKQILNHIICNLYPTMISEQYLSSSSNQKLTDRHLIHSDNESNFKIWQVLNNLGYQYKKQQLISQRQVDILIDQKIILEVDGQGHYHYLSKELAPATSFRNMHLLLSGYKLVTISMFEYNYNRSTEKLQKLIKEKIQLVRKEGVIYVC